MEESYFCHEYECALPSCLAPVPGTVTHVPGGSALQDGLNGDQLGLDLKGHRRDWHLENGLRRMDFLSMGLKSG